MGQKWTQKSMKYTQNLVQSHLFSAAHASITMCSKNFLKTGSSHRFLRVHVEPVLQEFAYAS